MAHATVQPGIAGGAMGVCAHCKRTRWIQARGLCQRCRNNPEVRALFPKGGMNPATAKHVTQHALDLVSWWLPQADEPTSARPGSAEKVLVMAERARQGRGVFHPQDSRA